MAITVTYQFTTSIPVDGSQPATAIVISQGDLLSARIDFHVNSHPATALEFTVANGVIGTANVGVTLVAATELAIARQRLARWIEFIRLKRPELSQSPTLKSKLEVDISPDHAELKFEFSVFQPNKKKLSEAVWSKSTGLITFESAAAVSIPWGDFLVWQQAIDDMLVSVALL